MMWCIFTCFLGFLLGWLGASWAVKDRIKTLKSEITDLYRVSERLSDEIDELNDPEVKGQLL